MYAYVDKNNNSVLLTVLEKVNWKTWVDTLELDTVHIYLDYNGDILGIELSDFSRYLSIGNIDVPSVNITQIVKPRDLLEKYVDRVICSDYIVDRHNPFLAVTFENLDKNKYLVNPDEEHKYIELEREIFAEISGHSLKRIVAAIPSGVHANIIKSLQ